MRLKNFDWGHISACDNWRDTISVVWRLHSLTALCFNPQISSIQTVIRVLPNLTKCIVLSHLQKLCKFCIFMYFLFSLKNVFLDYAATMYTQMKPLKMQYSSAAWDSDLTNSAPYQLVLQWCCKCHIYFLCKASLSTECGDEYRRKICDYSDSQCSREEESTAKKKEEKQREQNKSERRGR